MSQLGRDLRYAARMLARSPGFTAVALATLALGIGANTAIFSVVDAVLLRPLPYGEPDRLVAVYQTLPSQGVSSGGASYPNYADWAAQTKSFERLGAVRMHDYTMTGQGEPALVVAETVTSNVFALLRAAPLHGRGLVPSDDGGGAAPVAVLSEKLWRERFGGDPSAIGKTVRLDERLFTVVGVMPASFKTPPNVPPAELWTPLVQDPVFSDLREKRAGHYLTIVGRLAPGVSSAQAQGELAGIVAELARRFPKENEGWGVRLVPLAESYVAGVRTALLVLLGAVGLVFLIACANVANLLLARATSRAREVAIRTALGAGRGALLRQFLTECLLLGLVGGGLGLAVAAAGTGALRAWLPPDLPKVGEIGLDARVLAFSLLASIAAVVVFGLAPSLHASGANLSGALREGSAGTGESAGKRRLRHAFVAAETALSFVLLVGAGLLARSFARLQEVPLGFEPAHVLTAGMSLPRSQYGKPEHWLAFYSTLVDRLKSDPGVESVAASLPLPLYGGGLNFAFKIEGRPERPGTDLSANYTSMTPSYFRVLRIPLLKGRLIGDGDVEGSPRVCVISSAFAKRFFPGEDPIGRRLDFGFRESVSREIVGVVGDVRRDGLGAESRPEMYVPFAQDPWWAAYAVVRTFGDPAQLAETLRREVRALDPALPVEDVQPMTQMVSDSVAQPRFRTTLLGLFGLVALLLAVIGIYGVISYSVGRRTREVGIRMALGAGRRDVLKLVIGEGLVLTAAGLAIGALGAVVLTRYLATLLFEVGRLDPTTYVTVAATLLLAGVLACWVPARRASRVDPLTALRSE
ncbi:MAG TPA: ABC transporter permease [Thermoanaerobaculia bacterium]|nr:ABC transporter permease [Thermoanaerobaculia bacterium]